jgi:hypothetical protein
VSQASQNDTTTRTSPHGTPATGDAVRTVSEAIIGSWTIANSTA